MHKFLALLTILKKFIHTYLGSDIIKFQMKNIQGGIYGRTDKTKTKRYRGVGDLHSSSSAIIMTFRCFLMMGQLPSESMEPTLMSHDWLMGDRHGMRRKPTKTAAVVSCFIRKMKMKPWSNV